MAGASQSPPSGADGKICWLVSFPKSGNTWTRILLSNVIGEEDSAEEDDVKINLAGSISSNRVQFDNLTGLASSDLTDDEIDLLRPDGYRAIAAEAQDRIYTKVHDAYHDNGHGEPIFPADCSYGAIYLVRHPFDVAISYAYHQGHLDFAKIVDQMTSDDHVMAGGPKTQLRQKTFGWGGHYQSWHEQSSIPLLTIRYEDMIADTAACVRSMVDFLKLEQVSAQQIQDAVSESRFDKLQEKEAKAGFRERPEKAARFFRSGKTGEGAERLPPALQQRLREANAGLMEKLGYS